MPSFRCFIRGDNFPGEMVGRSGLYGFYTTRFVEAASPEEAEGAALAKLREESRLAPPEGYATPGRARVYFEQIEEISAEQAPAVQPGLVWYPMDSAS